MLSPGMRRDRRDATRSPKTQQQQRHGGHRTYARTGAAFGRLDPDTMTVAQIRGPIAALAMMVGCYSGWDGAKQTGSASDSASGSAEEGGSGGDTGDAPPLDACGGGIPQVAPHAMHRLTPLQYTNTIRDLFGDPEFAASYADLDPIPSMLGVRQLRTDAE